MQEKELKFLYEFLGNKIKELRKRSGFSQEALAKKLKLSRVSIVNIEKGRQHPSIHLLVDIARIMNAPLSTFLNDNLFGEYSDKVKLTQLKNKIAKEFDGDIDEEKILQWIKTPTNNKS